MNVLQWAELSTLTLTGYMMSKTKNHHLSADSCDDLFLPEPVTLVTVQRCGLLVLFCDFGILFQESEEAKKLREERLAQYESKKSKSMSTKNFEA